MILHKLNLTLREQSYSSSAIQTATNYYRLIDHLWTHFGITTSNISAEQIHHILRFYCRSYKWLAHSFRKRNNLKSYIKLFCIWMEQTLFIQCHGVVMILYKLHGFVLLPTAHLYNVLKWIWSVCSWRILLFLPLFRGQCLHLKGMDGFQLFF